MGRKGFKEASYILLSMLRGWLNEGKAVDDEVVLIEDSVNGEYDLFI
jgi:hypothetical protein